MIICAIYRNKKLIGKINTADYPDLDTINVGGDSGNTIVLTAEPALPGQLFSLSRLDGTFWLVATGEEPLSEGGETLSESMLTPGRIFQFGAELELVVSGEENPSEYALLFRAGKKVGWQPLNNGGNLLGGFTDLSAPDAADIPQLHFCCRCEINHAAITIESLDPQHPVTFRGLELTAPRTINPEELFYPAKGVPAKVVPRQNIEMRLKQHDPFYPQKLQWLAMVLLALLALLAAAWFYDQSATPVESGREFTFEQATPQFPKNPAAQEKFLEELEKSWLPNLQRDVYGKALADIQNMLENQALPPAIRTHFERREKEIRQVRSAIRLARYAETRAQIYSIANIAKHYRMPIPGREWIASNESDLAYWETIHARLEETHRQLSTVDRTNAKRVIDELKNSAGQIAQLVDFCRLNQAMYVAYRQSDYQKTAEILQKNRRFQTELQLFPGYPAFQRRLELGCAVARLHQQSGATELTPTQAGELLKNYAVLEKQLAESTPHASEFPLQPLREKLARDRQKLQFLRQFNTTWSRYLAAQTPSNLQTALENAIELDGTRQLLGNHFFQNAFQTLEKDYFGRVTNTATPLTERYAMIQAMRIPFNLNPHYAQKVAALENAIRQESRTRCLQLYGRYQHEPANRAELLRQIRLLALPGSSFHDWAARQNPAPAPVTP